MFEENKYLAEIFSEIIKRVVKNLIRSKIEQGESYEISDQNEWFYQRINTLKSIEHLTGFASLVGGYPDIDLNESHEISSDNEHLLEIIDSLNEIDLNESHEVSNNNENLFVIIDSLSIKDLTGFANLIEKYLEIDLCCGPIALIVESNIYDLSQNNLENEIELANEENCLICVYKIFRFFEFEYSLYNDDGDITFDKEKVSSIEILKKKNMFLKTLAKCVESFSVDNDLKEKAKKLIENCSKYNRAKFIIEEKEEIGNIMNSLKFRLSNLQELEKHDCLDELITDNTVPDDFEKTPFNKDQLVLTKSDIGNIVNTFQDSILNYVKSAREELSSKDDNTLIINDNEGHDQNNDLLIETRNSDMNNLLNICVRFLCVCTQSTCCQFAFKTMSKKE